MPGKVTHNNNYYIHAWNTAFLILIYTITHSFILLKSSSIFVLFLVSWGLGLVAIYLHEETYGEHLQHPFAIFYAALGVVVFVILCINKDVSYLFSFALLG